MTANNKFKNSVFTTLFDDPALLRELYCALSGASLPPDVPVTINTLENVLFLDFNNDISFEIGGKLVILIEHQSTINPNMALRLLIYISRVLEKMVKGSTLYSRKRQVIPWPEFFVLYNGKDPYPDTAVLKLSDLYEKPIDLLCRGTDNCVFLSEKNPLLELEVKVININEGKNVEIVNRCRKLADYSAFIARVHGFWQETGDLEEGVKKAIKYCSKHGILKEYLEVFGSEALNMILTEWNTEDAIAFAREEGREEGQLNGKIAIARNALAEGFAPESIQKITGLDLKTIQDLDH